MHPLFLQTGNQTNWMWSIAVPLGKASCLLRQWNTADLRHGHDKALLRNSTDEKMLKFTFATDKKNVFFVFQKTPQRIQNKNKKGILTDPVIISICTGIQISQFISLIQPCCDQSHCQTATKHYSQLAKYLDMKSTTQINIDRQAEAQTSGHSGRATVHGCLDNRERTAP